MKDVVSDEMLWGVENSVDSEILNKSSFRFAAKSKSKQYNLENFSLVGQISVVNLVVLTFKKRFRPLTGHINIVEFIVL